MAKPETNLPDKAALQQEEEALEKKNKWMYPVLIVFLTLVFSAGFIYGIQLVLNMEGAFPPVVLAEGRTPAPEDSAALAAYLREVASAALQEKPAFESEWKFRIDDDSIETDGSETLLSTLRFLVDPAEDAISAAVEKRAASYGEDGSAVLRLPEITAADISGFACDYVYYRCRSCGGESAFPVESCEICGYDHPYDMQYRNTYTFTVELNQTPALEERLFSPSRRGIEEIVVPHLGGYAEARKISAETTRLCISFVTERATDRLLKLIYRRESAIGAELQFAGDFSSLGKADCRAAVSDETVYSFTWPAIQLNKHTLVLAPGKREQITAERICDDPKAYEITWASSDETIVFVDQKGYVKAGKTPGNATVTASFTFQGKTYTDVCEVSVKISVEYIQINKHHLTLGVGGSETLKARVASDNKGFALKKPTVQTVTWVSSDENVARVDENGTVTGVAPGAATIFVYSDDGYYRASCEVTVEN